MVPNCWIRLIFLWQLPRMRTGYSQHRLEKNANLLPPPFAFFGMVEQNNPIATSPRARKTLPERILAATFGVPSRSHSCSKIMNHVCYLLANIAIFLIPSVASAALIDNFDNGVVTNSDSASGYWGTSSFGGSANDISEAASSLTFTIGDNDGSNESNFGGASIFSNGFQSEFDFLSNPVIIKVRGIEFGSTGTPFVGTTARHLRVGFVSSGTDAFSADDAVFARIFETGVSVRSKINETGANGQGTEQANLGSLNGVGGIDFLIGPGSAGMLNYSLIAYFPSGATAGSTSGTFAYDAASWNQGDHSSRLLIMAQELNVSGGNQVFTASLGSVSVTAVPEPSSFLLVAIAAGGSGWRHRR